MTILYKITEFNAISHFAVVEFTNPTTNKLTNLTVSIPIKSDNTYPVGDELDTYVNSILTNYLTPYVNDVSNLNDIQNLVQPTDMVTTEKMAIHKLNSTRSVIFRLTDFTQLPDAPEYITPELKSNWATYRQAIRDLPTQSGWPINVVWPIPPTAVKEIHAELEDFVGADGIPLTYTGRPVQRKV